MSELRARARDVAALLLAASLLLATLLTARLVRANPPLGGAAIAELAAALFELALIWNGVLLAALLLLWPALRRWMGERRGSWRGYLVCGLGALHVAWALLNRLTLTQTWIRPPRFLTIPGLAQLVALVAITACVTLAGVRFGCGRRRAAAALLAVAATIGAVCLLWNGRREIAERRYSLVEVRRAAETAGAAVSAGAAGRGGAARRGDADAPLVVLAFDGLTWSVMKPLLAAGQLPGFAELIRRGAIGYLDNGDESLSPRIWATLFTGRSVAEHGVAGFRKLVLPRSGAEIGELGIVPPSLHTSYGLGHLLERVPTLGLREMRTVGAHDRRAKTIWEVASDFGRRVLVIDPMSAYPVHPVAGTMLVFSATPGPLTAFPPEIGREWRERAHRAGVRRRSWRTLRADSVELHARAAAERAFALELFVREPFDLGIYYSKLADEVAHLGWSFSAGGRALVTAAPDALDDDAWEHLVLGHADAPLFAAYRALDEMVSDLLLRAPANFVVVSDHGWTFSGFEHYGAQDGIVILSGPAFAGGADLALSRVEDVAPTVLALLGVPLSRELAGAPLVAAVRAWRAPASVVTYGEPKRAPGFTSTEDDEELQRLRALGYVQ